MGSEFHRLQELTQARFDESARQEFEDLEAAEAERREAEAPVIGNASRSDSVENLAVRWDGVAANIHARKAKYEQGQTALVQARASVNVNQITASDLAKDERFAALFIELSRRGEVAPTDEGVLRCLMAAHRALARDDKGTPGAMFRYMIRPKTPERYFTSEAQDVAQRRMNAGQRAELAEAALEAPPLAIDPARLQAPDKRIAASERDLGFMPAILLQAFLPQRRLPDTASHYTTTHGRAWLAVSAGMGSDAHGRPTRLHVPFGVYGRLVLAYLCTHARASSTISIGHPRKFLRALRVPYGGPAALQVSTQVGNLAACGFTLGYARENGAGPDAAGPDAAVLDGLESMSLASGVRYAEPRKGRSPSKPRPRWIVQLDLDPRFRAQVLEHRAPVRLDHLAQLQKRPRAMDIYLFIGYRVRNVGPEPDEVPLSELRSVFAPAMPSRKWPSALKNDLAQIRKVHPFKAYVVGDILVLHRSPLPVLPRTG